MTTPITPTPELLAIEAKLKDAIRDTLDGHADTDGRDYNERLTTALYKAVMAVWKDSFGTIIQSAMGQEAFAAAMAQSIVVPTIREAEDTLNDDHDDPKTHDMYRPGLRRATRTLREIRRTIEAETKP